jgi:hypothetical protein
LAARDLLLQGLDIGVLLEKKICDAGNDPGLVPPDDGDGGKLLHGMGNEPNPTEGGKKIPAIGSSTFPPAFVIPSKLSSD